jgi:hypothetical protein
VVSVKLVCGSRLGESGLGGCWWCRIFSTRLLVAVFHYNRLFLLVCGFSYLVLLDTYFVPPAHPEGCKLFVYHLFCISGEVVAGS